MDQLSASELSALELSVADDAEQAEAPLAEAPLTAPPAWTSEAAAWTPRGHLTAAQAASARDSAAATFSYIANCATPGAAAVDSIDVRGAGFPCARASATLSGTATSSP